jgi:osmoprotectant transport system ATP-binding protein
VLRLEHLTKRFGGQLAVDDLNLEVAEGELCVLVGPSGCGKTTTMKMVNRLIEPTSGRILLDGDDVTDGDPVVLRRRIGYVIQQVGLFPHQSIATNVGTVCRLLGWDKARVADRVDELLDLVGLDPATYRDRYPHQLSGGQRQRVGVARALGADPPVLLMDEPFGAIDPITRERLQNEFLRLQGRLRKTVVFVTHDVDEAVKLGDRIAVLAQGGVLAQHDTPAEILSSPRSSFVADFVGSDRGLKRLAVTPIECQELDQPPVVAPDSPLADVRQVLTSGGGYAVVVDSEGRLRGWLGREQADGEGAAGAHVQPAVATVTLPASLRDALSALLLAEAGWVAVLDEQRFCGVLTLDTLHAATRQRSTDQDGARSSASTTSPAAT